MLNITRNSHRHLVFHFTDSNVIIYPIRMFGFTRGIIRFLFSTISWLLA